MTLRAALAAAGFACFVVAGPHAAAPEPDRFTLGVLRRDGIIAPFATFDGQRWRHDWPPPMRDRDIPITLAAVPSRWWGPLGPRETWQAWIDAAAPIALHVSHPDVYTAQCNPQVGLRSDYRSSAPSPPDDAQPYPKDGLAVSPPHAIERIDIMPVGVAPAPLVDAFNDAETLAVTGAGGPLVKINKTQRHALPAKVEAVYAAGPASSRIYYFEMVREYDRATPGTPGQCQAVSFGAGWFAGDSEGTLRQLAFDVTVSSCDRDGVLYMLPLGIIRSGGRMFWVSQASGWDFEQYDVFEIKPGAPENLVRAPGGSC